MKILQRCGKGLFAKGRMPRKLTLKLPDSVPDQWSKEFLQGMIDRMAVGYFKYGPIDKEAKRDFKRTLDARLKRYFVTGNTEWLMDVANFCMMEFMYPHHKEAHFRGTDSRESPGIYKLGEVDPTQRHNSEI